MKPTIPAVPLTVWKDLHIAAQSFAELRPWKILDDLDLIGVRDPLTNDVGYGIVMGSGGTLFGLCLYRGVEGFNIYRGLMDGSASRDPEDDFVLQNSLMLEYGPRSDLGAADHAVIKELGLTFKGKAAWPLFRSLLPGYAPWHLTEAEARFLTLGLAVACHHCERVINGNVDDSIRDHQCLVYVPLGDSRTEFQAQWEPWPTQPVPALKQPVLNLATINAIRQRKPQPDTPWEADVFYLPAQIDDRERPYFFRTAAICQQLSGFAFGVDAAYPEDSAAQLLADAVCSAIAKSGFMPDVLYVRNAELAAALAPLGNALGFTIRHQKKLKAIRMLKTSLTQRFVLGGGGRRR